METRSFPASDGLVLNCVDYGGDGRRPLLFIHGGSAHARWWDFVAPAFIERFHVMALDLRGHGDSPWTTEWAYGTRHYVADLSAIIGAWGLGAPVLVGHSMGGHTVMTYAGMHCDAVRALAASDSPATYPPEAVGFLRGIAERPGRRFDSLEEACANFKTNPPDTRADPAVLRHIAELSFRQDGDGKWVHKMDRRTMIREPISAFKMLANIRRPALYVRPARSPMPREMADQIIARLPNGRAAEVPESNHHVPLDNPAGLVKVLGAFFAELDELE
jgi:pimeloyl-ACP methyl ester carboxylesterase